MAVLSSDKLDLVSILEDGPYLLVSTTLCHLLSLSSLLLNNGTQQHRGNGTSMILLQTIIYNFCLTSSLSLLLPWLAPEETSCHFGEAHMARNWEQSLANHQRVTGTLGPAVHEESIECCWQPEAGLLQTSPQTLDWHLDSSLVGDTKHGLSKAMAHRNWNNKKWVLF